MIISLYICSRRVRLQKMILNLHYGRNAFEMMRPTITRQFISDIASMLEQLKVLLMVRLVVRQPTKVLWWNCGKIGATSPLRRPVFTYFLIAWVSSGLPGTPGKSLKTQAISMSVWVHYMKIVLKAVDGFIFNLLTLTNMFVTATSSTLGEFHRKTFYLITNKHSQLSK